MEPRIASSGERIRSSIVDGAVLLPLFFLDQAIQAATQAQWVLFIYFLISFHAGWIYTTLLHGWRGQTLGKMLIGIVVVRLGETGPLGFKRAALRDSPYIVLITICSGVWIYAHVAWLGGWYSESHQNIVEKVFTYLFYINVGWSLLELLTMLFHPQRRALHDLIAGTIVIAKEKASA